MVRLDEVMGLGGSKRAVCYSVSTLVELGFLR
jgi:hypothetical protein